MAAGAVARAVARSLRAVPPGQVDAAAVALAKLLAQLLDDAAVVHGAAIVALEEWDREDPIGRAYVQKLADALAAHKIVADLEPRLLEVLKQLLYTPAARGAKPGGAVTHDPAADELLALRNRPGRRTG